MERQEEKIPHSRVNEGEILYFMQKGSKKISAKAMVTHVDNYTKLTDSEIIEKLNNPKLDLTDKQKERWHKKCLILVEFSGLRRLNLHLILNIKEIWMIG